MASSVVVVVDRKGQKQQQQNKQKPRITSFPAAISCLAFDFLVLLLLLRLLVILSLLLIHFHSAILIQPLSLSFFKGNRLSCLFCSLFYGN